MIFNRQQYSSSSLLHTLQFCSLAGATVSSFTVSFGPYKNQNTSILIYSFICSKYSQTSVTKCLPSGTIWFLTKLFTEKNVSVVEPNFSSQHNNPFMLIPVWPVTHFSGTKQRREWVHINVIWFSNKLLLELPSGTN